MKRLQPTFGGFKFHLEGVVTIKQAKKVPNNEEKNQNWKDIFFKPFRIMAIMASFFFPFI
jgi:hypothetical protein